jgi:glutamine---fructose-6-phosphate transaminase (isomerizing)
MSADDQRVAPLRSALEATATWAEAATSREAIVAALDVARAAPGSVLAGLRNAARVVVTGAGSSYYLAQIAAAALREACRLPAVAVPLSEVLLRPDGVFADLLAARQLVVAVSRSGSTSEAVGAVEWARKAGHPTLAITCRGGSPMAVSADATLTSPLGDEVSIVMTRSFASMLALLLRLAARLAPDPALGSDLDRLADHWPETQVGIARALELAASGPTRVVVLGGGAALGLANEAVLKLTEMGQVPASAFEPLEFRHGPISVCEPGMLVVGLLGGPSEAVEARVLDESAALGATIWSLGADGPAPELHPIARLPLLLHPLQALALGVALQRGCDPDRPRHLSQVVVLADD